MRVLGIIPARGGSKGVPRKNIRELAGRPLIAWTISAAKESRLTRVIVSTEDREVAETALRFGAEVPFTRPTELATDSARAIPVLQHAVRFCEEAGEQYEAVMMLQPTSPMRLSTDIDCAIDKLAGDALSTSVISVVPVDQHPARMKYLDDDVLVDPPFCEAHENQARQELVPMYVRSGHVYLVRTPTLMTGGGSLKGTRCRALMMPRSRSVNIDSMFDFDLASWLMNQPDWRHWK